jgi:hypothetical protein
VSEESVGENATAGGDGRNLCRDRRRRTIAALKKLADARAIDPDEVVVAYITGNGLKTQDAVVPRLAVPLHITPTLRVLLTALATVG